jgi:hypothetical protein
MTRFELINEIVSINNFKTYLEIGVFKPEICFDQINCEKKTGVDPGIENPENPVDYKVTSDEFFDMLSNGETEFSVDHKWDVVFIDGLHLADQVYKDINNSLRHLSDNGFIVLHDCLPPNSFMAREDYDVNGIKYLWNGTTWKAYYKALTELSYVDVCVYNSDWGLGLIKKCKRRRLPKKNNPFYEYNVMARDFINEMNIVDHNTLIKFITNK